MNNSVKSKNSSFLKIAKISCPHGIGGGVKLFFFPGSIFDLKLIKTLVFFLNDHFITYDIEKIKGPIEKPIIYFSNIKNIDYAKYLQGKMLCQKDITLRW